MRRKDKAISIEEARGLLESAEYGVLSMASADGTPYGLPLNFAFEDDHIYFHCACEGKKIDIFSTSERASFCVVGETQVVPENFETKYESVIASGTVEELFDDIKHHGLVLLIKKYSPDYMDKGLEYIQNAIDKTKVFRIRIETITGKAQR